MATDGKSPIEIVATTAQVVSIVVGVVISVVSFNTARDSEAEARRLEAAKPFLTLRQNTYTEVVKLAAVLSNPDIYSPEELTTAKKRFRALYVAELSMVESKEVEQQMMALAVIIDPTLVTFTPAQSAAYDLSHALRDTYITTWGLDGK